MKLNWVYVCRDHCGQEVWMKFFYHNPTKEEIDKFKSDEHVSVESVTEYVGEYNEEEEAWIAREGG
jgi:hypothetical protein